MARDTGDKLSPDEVVAMICGLELAEKLIEVNMREQHNKDTVIGMLHSEVSEIRKFML